MDSIKYENGKVNGYVIVNANVSANDEAKKNGESKAIKIKVLYNNADFEQVINDHASHMKIKAVNGKLRKQYDTLKVNETYEITFNVRQLTTQVDPETAMVNKLQGMTAEEQLKYIQDLMAKVKK